MKRTTKAHWNGNLKGGKGEISSQSTVLNQTPIRLKHDSSLVSATATRRQQYFQDFTIPFFGYNRERANISQGIRDNWSVKNIAILF